MLFNGSDLQGSLHFMFMLTAVAHDAFGGPFINVWKFLSLWTVYVETIIPQEEEHYIPSGSRQAPRHGSHCAGLSHMSISGATTVLRGLETPIDQA